MKSRTTTKEPSGFQKPGKWYWIGCVAYAIVWFEVFTAIGWRLPGQ